jgi:hypothetical protein
MSGKEMESRRGSIEIIDANEEPTVGARSNKIYTDFDMKGKPIVVEDLTSCDGRDDTVDYLGSKRSRFSFGLSPETGRILKSPDESEKATDDDDDDDDDDPPSEVHWASRDTGKKVDSPSGLATVRVTPPSEVKRDKIEEGFTFHNSADKPFETEELLAKLGIGQKQQATRQTGKTAFSTTNSAVAAAAVAAHIDGIPHGKVDDSTSESARALHRKAVLENRKAALEKSILRRYNAALATTHGKVGQNAIQVDSSTAKYHAIPSKSRDGLHAVSSDDDRLHKAIRAKPARKLSRREVKISNDLAARSDIIHISDDEVCTDLVSNSSNTATWTEAPDEVPVKSSSSRARRVECLDQASSKAIDLVKSSSSLSERMEALDQVHIGIKTNTQKRVDVKDVDTESKNAILGEPGKQIQHDGPRNYRYALDADKLEQREKSMQEEEDKSRSFDIIHIDSRDDEDISMRAIGNREYDSDDISESAVKSEAASEDGHAEIEESDWDIPEAKESGVMRTVEKSYTDSPLLAENNYGTPMVNEDDQDPRDLVGSSGGNNLATRFELVGNDREERAQQGNTESDDEPELVQLMQRKKGSKAIDNRQSAKEGATYGATKLATADGIDRGMEHNTIHLIYPEEDLKETVQDNFELSRANARKKSARLDFQHDSKNVTEKEPSVDRGMEQHVPQLAYPEKDDLESIIAQGSFQFITASTDQPFRSGLAFHDSGNFVENNTNDDGGVERNATRLVEQEDSDSDSGPGSGLRTPNTRQRVVRVDYNDFRNVVGNSANADGGMERFSQLVDVVDDDEDRIIAGPSAANDYNRDLAISDETSSESCGLKNERQEFLKTPGFDTPTPKAANKSTKEVRRAHGNFHDSENAIGVDNGNFYNSEDENTAESGSKVSMEESKCSLESDLEIDIEEDDVYESFAVPFVVEMLDRSCAWFEEKNSSMSCSRREPSLLDKTKKWTPPAKKSTFLSRKSTNADKNSDIQNKKRTLSRSERAAKTFDTTAITPQNTQQPETVTRAENATKEALASGVQPIEQDNATEKLSKDTRPHHQSANKQKKKTSKRRVERAQEKSDDPDSYDFHEKLRHLWTMKRQAQKYKHTQDQSEHSEDSERQSSAENSTASSAKSLSPRFIARSMTAPTATKSTRPDETHVRRPLEHPTKALAASSLAAKTVMTTGATAMPSVSSYAFTEAVSARYLASRPASQKAVAETEDSVARSIAPEASTVSPYGFSETESLPARNLATGSASPNAFAETEEFVARSIAPEAFALSPNNFSGAEFVPARYIRRHVVQPIEASVASSVAAETAVSVPARYLATRSAAPKAFTEREGPVARSVSSEAFARAEALSASVVTPQAATDRFIQETPSQSAYSKRAQPLPEASDLNSPEQEPPALQTTRVIRLARLAGGPESIIKPSRSIVAGGPESMVTPSRAARRREHAEALIALEQEENHDNIRIAAAEEAIAEAFTLGYDTLNETERLDAIGLAERLQRRASALKRRRIQRQKKLMDLQDMQDMDDSNTTDEDSFLN